MWGATNWRVNSAGPAMSIQHEPHYAAYRASAVTAPARQLDISLIADTAFQTSNGANAADAYSDNSIVALDAPPMTDTARQSAS